MPNPRFIKNWKRVRLSNTAYETFNVVNLYKLAGVPFSRVPFTNLPIKKSFTNCIFTLFINTLVILLNSSIKCK